MKLWLSLWSLLALCNVISKLSEKGKKGKDHIPFRDSKLTRILSVSLGGNARTGVLCAVSPAVTNYYETVQTLRFAQRAKKVVNKVTKNEIVNNKTLIKQYKLELEAMRKQLAQQHIGKPDQQTLAATRQEIESEMRDKFGKEVCDGLLCVAETW